MFLGSKRSYNSKYVMGVPEVKLHYIYLLIGVSTFALNFALTLHIIRKRISTSCKNASWDYDDVMTFSLTRERSAEGATTVAVPYDDTVLLE